MATPDASLEAHLRSTLAPDEQEIWDRTPHSALSPSQLEMLTAYCRLVASSVRLSAKIEEWSDMDPISELKELHSMRGAEIDRANKVRASIANALKISESYG